MKTYDFFTRVSWLQDLFTTEKTNAVSGCVTEAAIEKNSTKKD